MVTVTAKSLPDRPVLSVSIECSTSVVRPISCGPRENNPSYSFRSCSTGFLSALDRSCGNPSTNLACTLSVAVRCCVVVLRSLTLRRALPTNFGRVTNCISSVHSWWAFIHRTLRRCAVTCLGIADYFHKYHLSKKRIAR